MTEMFKSMLMELDNDEIRSFYRNVILHLNYKTEKTIVKSMSHYDFDKQYEEIKQSININKMNVDNKEEIFHVIQIVSTIMIQNFVLKFAKELSNE